MGIRKGAEATLDISKWLAVVSGVVTVVLSSLNGYWSHHISEVDEAIKVREQDLKYQQYKLEVGKGKLERYTFVQTLLEGALNKDPGHRTVTVNLIKLALGNDEAAQLFAGLDMSKDPVLRDLGATGSQLVNTQFRVFVHLRSHDGSAVQDLAPVQAALSKAGFQVKGSDDQVDKYGPGVDYFYDSDKSGAERVAAILNDLVGTPAKPFVARRQSAKNAEGTLGVWF